MTLVVTGGAGFIGSNLIRYLRRTHPEERVVCLDKLTYAGNFSNLFDVLSDKMVRFVRIDICDRKAVYQIFEEEHPDAVLNLAAESHVDRSITQPELFLQTNIIGTAVILDACCRYQVSRFHQVSTDEVYGDLGLEQPEHSFSEDMPLCTSSPYSSSKASADLLALSYYRTYGLPVTISRCSNNYGPYQFPEKLIPLMVWNAMRNRPLPVYGTGGNIRDWLHVEDHCRALDQILRYGQIGEIYNIGAGNEQRNLDIVRRICAELGTSEQMIQFVPDRPGHDLRYAIDSSKLYHDLGWEPTIDFTEGMRATIRWYQEHQDWLERIFSGEYRRDYERWCARQSAVTNRQAKTR